MQLPTPILAEIISCHPVLFGILIGHEQIENGDLFLWIHDKEPEIDQSLYLDDDRSAMLVFFQRLGSAADAKRKYNVEENGLCLLLAYCLEGLQHELRS